MSNYSMRHLGRTLGAAAVSLALLASPALARELNIAMTPPEESHYGAAAKAFKEQLEKLSGGKLTVSIKSNGVLGGEREIIEGMQIGSVDMGITSTGPVGGFVPSTYVLDLPFLFKDSKSARTILDGEIGQQLLNDFEPVGIVALGWAENGFRHVTNSRKPIEKPADLSGMKIRTMENDIHLKSFKAAGSAPTPMSWNEVITALQQGTIDGQETPMSIFLANRIWEVQKYASLTGHVYSPSLIMISKIHWDAMSPEEQGWVREAAKAGVEANRAYVTHDDERGIAILKQNGMQVNDVPDRAAFVEIMEPVYKEYVAKNGGEMLDRIRAAQE